MFKLMCHTLGKKTTDLCRLALARIGGLKGSVRWRLLTLGGDDECVTRLNRQS